MSQVQEFFSITPWTIIFSFCNLLILCLLIKKFLFKPVMNILAARQAEVDGIYDEANRDRQQAAVLKEDYDRHMAGAREEADQLVKNTLDSANRRGDALVTEAQAQVSTMIQRAKSEIEQERNKAFVEVTKELSGMAVDIAEQMVSREIKSSDYDKLVDEFIRNAGDKA